MHNHICYRYALSELTLYHCPDSTHPASNCPQLLSASKAAVATAQATQTAAAATAAADQAKVVAARQALLDAEKAYQIANNALQVRCCHCATMLIILRLDASCCQLV